MGEERGREKKSREIESWRRKKINDSKNGERKSKENRELTDVCEMANADPLSYFP